MVKKGIREILKESSEARWVEAGVGPALSPLDLSFLIARMGDRRNHLRGLLRKLLRSSGKVPGIS